MLTGAPSGVSPSLGFSPDGKKIYKYVGKGDSQAVRILNAESGRELFALTQGGGYLSVVGFFQGGKTIIVEEIEIGWDMEGIEVENRTLRLLDAETGRELYVFPETFMKMLLGVSPDGNKIAMAMKDNTIRIWNFDAAMKYYAEQHQ